MINLTALLPLFLFASCIPSDSPNAPTLPTMSASDLVKTEWVLSELNGRPILSGSNITLTFEDKSLGGYGGCNWYGASWTNPTPDGRTIRIGAAEATARGCKTGLMEQETAYFTALRQATEFQAAAGRLQMRNKAGEVVLDFRQRKPLPMDPIALVGTKWLLRAMNGENPPSDISINLSFSKDTVEGFAGCRSFTGTWSANGDHIRFPSLSMNSTECNRGQALLLFEGQYTTDLSESTIWRLSGDTLEIVTAQGRVLSFVRRK